MSSEISKAAKRAQDILDPNSNARKREARWLATPRPRNSFGAFGPPEGPNWVRQSEFLQAWCPIPKRWAFASSYVECYLDFLNGARWIRICPGKETFFERLQDTRKRILFGARRKGKAA
jgi:hypothetical protein